MSIYERLKRARNIIFNNNFIFYPLIYFISIWVYLYFIFVIFTSKITFNLEDNKKENLRNNTYILAFWHGRLLSAFFIRKFFSKSCVLVSYNKSSYIVKLLANYFRTSVVRGSSNKGGRGSIKQILNLLKKERTVFAIAPDGSIGPRMQCSFGIVNIALLSQRKILPIIFSAKRGKILNSWDRFFVPYPFNDITVHLAQEIDFKNPDNSKRDVEDIRINIETVLNKMTWELDKQYGVEKIEPSSVNKKGKELKLK